MPYTFQPPNPAFRPSDDLPLHLEHKPFYGLPYEAFDGPYAGHGKTDMRFISVGIAQYDPYDVSIKTMRYTGTKWTRQAEELPLHRVVDMALYLAKVLFDTQQGGAVTLPAGTLSHQTSDITITQEPHGRGETASYNAAISKHLPDLQARFNVLLDLLNNLKKQVKI